jgi:CBS domain-containing protein
MRISELLDGKGQRVATVDPADRVSDAIALLAEWGIGALVASADGKTIAGIISERDIVRSLAEEHEWTLRLRVDDLMTKTVVTCAPTDTVDSLMSLMTANRIRHVPVVEHGELTGIVSIGDVVNIRLQELEAEASAVHDYITLGR